MFGNIQEFILNLVYSLPCIFVALTFHEFSHAFAAVKLGDPTPKYQGRLTLNPLAHLDLFGTIAMILFRIGWAKPVMIDTRNFKNPRRDNIIVSLAGPFMNLALGFVTYIVYSIAYQFAAPAMISSGVTVLSVVMQMLQIFFFVNIMLAVFNLIPIPPLDGSHILLAFLPYKAQRTLQNMQPYMPILLLVLLYTGILSRFIISPVSNFIVYIFDFLTSPLINLVVNLFR